MKSIPIKAMLRSLFISYLISFLLLFLLALISYRFRLAENQITLIVYAVYLTACLAGGFLAGKSIRQRRFLWGMLSGILYFSVLFVVSWFAADGSLSGLNDTLTIMAMCIASGTLGGMLS